MQGFKLEPVLPRFKGTFIPQPGSGEQQRVCV